MNQTVTMATQQPPEPERDDYAREERYHNALSQAMAGNGPFCDERLHDYYDQSGRFFVRFCALLRREPPMTDAELGKLARLEFARLASEYADEVADR